MTDLIEWYTEHYAEINASAQIYTIAIAVLILIITSIISIILKIKKK